MDAFLNGSNGIRVVWTPDSQYRVTQSAYNAAARSQTVIPLRPARYMHRELVSAILTSGSTCKPGRNSTTYRRLADLWATC